MHLWRKNVTVARAEHWSSALAAAGIGPERLVTAQTVRASNRVRLEVYCEHAEETDRLQRGFGGSARALRPGEWQTWLRSASDDPLPLGRGLLVTPREDELDALRAAHPGRHVLCIPAAMAFGTGEHATTAMCARLLATVCREQPAGTPWDLLDLGAGSGILALAGRCFGAREVLGLDHDPHAVRTARENARLNGLTRGVRFARADLLRWAPPAGRRWPVVVANLFSELILRVLPTAILPALLPGGRLVASGVLGTQAAEVEVALRRAGLTILETKRRGRWRAFSCTLLECGDTSPLSSARHVAPSTGAAG